MGDRIFINDLRLKCRIGVTDEERREPQEVVADVSLFAGLERAGASDDLNDTLDYIEATQRISEFAFNREFKLLESLAEGIATLMLKVVSVEKVTVKVRKAKYLSEPSIGIEIERVRHG